MLSVKYKFIIIIISFYSILAFFSSMIWEEALKMLFSIVLSSLNRDRGATLRLGGGRGGGGHH